MWNYVNPVTIGLNEMWLAFDGSYDSEGVFTISDYEVWDDEACKGFDYLFDELYEKIEMFSGEVVFRPVMDDIIKHMEEKMTDEWEKYGDFDDEVDDLPLSKRAFFQREGE